MKNLIKIMLASILGATLLMPSADAAVPLAGNLVLNPSFETGLSSWTQVAGSASVVPYGSANGPTVAAGSTTGGGGNYLRDSSGGAIIEQVIATGIIPAGMNVLARGYFGGAANDDARLVVRFLGSGGGELSRSELPYVTEANRNAEAVLLLREVIVQPPAGTVSVAARVELRNNCCSGALGAADLIHLELVSTPTIPSAYSLGTELLTNGDFESGWAPGSPLTPNDPQGWEGQNSSRAIVKAYSDSDGSVPNTLVSCLIGGGTPTGSCAPGGAGNLASDLDGGAVLRQRIDVRGNTPSFSPSGTVALQVRAFLGGVSGNDDAARVDVSFLNENLVVIAPASPVGPVSNSERNGQTVLLLEEVEYTVPASTAFIDVAISFVNACCSGAQGLSDNVSARLVAPTPPTPLSLDSNLVLNPSFEDGSLPGSPLQLNIAGGWRGENGAVAEVLSYGATSAAPPSAFTAEYGLGGLVAGDLGGGSVLRQTFDLIGSASLVDAGRLRIYAACWLGGVGSDNDSAQLQVQFVNQAGVQVGGAGGLQTLPQVTATDRNNITSLLQRVSDFPVPATARRMILRLEFLNACCSGAWGLADDVELIAYDVGGPGFAFCPGDGSSVSCPCGNNSAPASNDGCRNSLGLAGRLRAIGTPSLAADTLVLVGSQMPSAPALFFQGSAQQNGGAGVPFGDGLRCASGVIIRLGTKANAGGASQYPEGGDASISVRGGVTSPGIRTYQVWYRNAAGFCAPSTFNLTNGWQATWRF